MNKITLRQTLIPLITITIICFLWFGPIRIGYIENIIISILIIIANYIEYEGKPFLALGFQREKFTFKNILVLAPLVALGLFVFYVFAVVPGVTKLTGVPIDYSSFDQLKGDLPACLIALLLVWATAGFGEEIIFRGYFMLVSYTHLTLPTTPYVSFSIVVVSVMNRKCISILRQGVLKEVL